MVPISGARVIALFGCYFSDLIVQLTLRKSLLCFTVVLRCVEAVGGMVVRIVGQTAAVDAGGF